MVVATAVAQVVLVLAGVITKRLLGPINVAAWALATAILSYAALTQFGVLDALLLRVPLVQARGGTSLRRLVAPALCWVLLLTIPGAAIIGVFAWYQGAAGNAANALAVGFVIPLLVLFQLTTLGVTLARATGDFQRVAWATIGSAAAFGVAGVALVYAFGLPGQVAAFGIGLLVQLAIYLPYLADRGYWKSGVLPGTIQTATALVRAGFPLQSGSALLTVRQALDTVLGVMILGPLAGGVYSLATSFRAYLVALPNAVGTVLFRTLRVQHGEAERRGNPECRVEWWIDAVEVNSLMLVLPGAALLALGGPILVRWVFPDFAGASRLVAVIPIAAAGMMMEPVAYQRLLASGATTTFRRLAALSLLLMLLGSLPGLLARSGLLLAVGVGLANTAALAFSLCATLGRGDVPRSGQFRLWLISGAAFLAVALLSLLGLGLDSGIVRLSAVATVVLSCSLAGLSIFAGALRARRLRVSANA
jgi:O-antigen/teichoic acid export membrane protein